MDSDLLIVGSGVAGLTAAIRARELGCKVLVVSKEYPTQAQTTMAQGGINAALDGDIEGHVADTLKAGGGLADPVMVERICSKGPELIAWLDRIGMPFSRIQDRIAQRSLGGASSPRACYAQDYTGLKLLQTLYDRARSVGVHFLPNHYLLNLIVEEGRVLGGTLLDLERGAVRQQLAKATILATGGFARIYGNASTNRYGVVGEGLGAALRAGARVSDLEFVQFHPTALAGSAILISEAARGAGGWLVNGEGERFVDELATRDQVARAIYQQLEEGQRVYLDIRHLGEDFIDTHLPQERRLALLHAGIDPVHELLPIRPAPHYTMGGIDVARDWTTSLEGLFAIGECANPKFHGANRLGGNSLLEGLVTGWEVAYEAAQCQEASPAIEYKQTVKDRAFLQKLFDIPATIDRFQRRSFLERVLYHNAGLVREEQALKGVLATIRQHQQELSLMGLRDRSWHYNTDLLHFLEYGNMLEVAEAAVVAMEQRKESRGAHYRQDYPETRKEFQGHLLLWKEEGVLHTQFRQREW
ncbi:MAG: succinate dehydrogenase [Nitratiruptor sp.]|nr:succinate dehydrogenase [Nitratiruptor sp.]NPA82922.1 FAD-binding protein [Campylobacterota bacterium]